MRLNADKMEQLLTGGLVNSGVGVLPVLDEVVLLLQVQVQTGEFSWVDKLWLQLMCPLGSCLGKADLAMVKHVSVTISNVFFVGLKYSN